MRYIALLRGVNVGGNNKLSMPDLRAAFERAGSTDVATCINSGNVLFSGAETDIVNLAARCQALIGNEFNMDIAICILTVEELRDAPAHARPGGIRTRRQSTTQYSSFRPQLMRDVFARVGTIKPEYERVNFYGRMIFWTAPIRTFSKTRRSKIAGASAYRSIAIRSANTAAALSRLCVPSGQVG